MTCPSLLKSLISVRAPTSSLHYHEDICKLKGHMWEAGQLKDASAHRLEGANALHRIEEALVELNHRAVGQQALTECGGST